MNIISLCHLHRDKSNTILGPTQSQLTSSGYLLLFTSSANFIYGIWKLAADIGLISSRQESDVSAIVLYTIFNFVAIIHVWIQTQHIMTINYLHRARRNIPQMSRLTLIYLIMINFVEWMCLSITHSWIESVDDFTIFVPETSIFLVTLIQK